MESTDSKIYKYYLFFAENIKYYIEILVIEINLINAKNKIINKCLEKFDEIKKIHLREINIETFEKPKYDFSKMSIRNFKEWLNKKINLEDIDCVGDYRF